MAWSRWLWPGFWVPNPNSSLALLVPVPRQTLVPHVHLEEHKNPPSTTHLRGGASHGTRCRANPLPSCGDAWDRRLQHGCSSRPTLGSMLRPRKIQQWHPLPDHAQCNRQLESLAPLLKDADGQDGGLTHGCKKSRLPAHPSQPWQR
ncbi:uncharacterized protein LOC123443585 [Hordeum vulgare subsp. vulgare]|uniref:uncharacterized protein LOC123443585 n=1 Tax=Hordeum vulgare subsp. vulgare TaxID=112509 RepID=UPI001D1A51F1|nr:uncharacterized protein LOC123443585 [Hordeum vulgare subsp. vulgare]XP_044975952.1 uncharacterized protein LOC123443585 [Hordeum vulgare subsp. vulgare]